MLDLASITFVTGIISCVIGVSSFISGRMARAERNGSMETKITQALDGITSINRKLEEYSNRQTEVSLLVQSHEEKIRTLFNNCEAFELRFTEELRTRETIMELIHTLREERRNEH